MPARPNATSCVDGAGNVIAVSAQVIVFSPDVREGEVPKVLFRTLCHRGNQTDEGNNFFRRRGGNDTIGLPFFYTGLVDVLLTAFPIRTRIFFHPLAALAIQRNPPLPLSPRISLRTESHLRHSLGWVVM